MPKLTKKIVDQMELPDKGQKFIWDEKLTGFGVRLTPGGKSYFVQARVNGTTRRVTIGKHGVSTADEARKEAKEQLHKMSKGIDPVKEKKAEELAKTTLNDVAESYIRDRDLKPTTIKDIRKHLKDGNSKRNGGVFKDWKDKPIKTITRDDCLALFRKRSAESPAQANQAFRILRALFNYGIEVYKPAITENPVQVLSGAGIWNTIKPKNRKIPIADIGRAWKKLEEIKTDPTLGIAGHSMVDAVKFCLLTGCRWGEAQKLTWRNVDMVNHTWHIEDPKNKNSVTLPLSSQALELLEDRFRTENNPFVFCSEKSKTGHIGPGRYVTDRIAADLDIELSPHDLRRTFRSIAAELDIELWRTKLLMNHRINNDVTIAAYTEKEDLSYLRKSIDAIGEWIERQGNIAKAGNVVDFNSKKHEVS